MRSETTTFDPEIERCLQHILLNAPSPSRVLEVASGRTPPFFPHLAQRCASYIYVGPFAGALEEAKSQVDMGRHFRHVDLLVRRATDLAFIDSETADVVILNSFANTCRSVDELVAVLSEAVRVSRREGFIFLSCVNSLPLLLAYHASRQSLQLAGPGARAADFRRRVWQARWREEELALNVDLFEQLRRHTSRIGRLEIWPTLGEIDRRPFQYHVGLRIGPKQVLERPAQRVEWDSTGRWRDIVRRAVAASDGSAIELRGIPDRRIVNTIHKLPALDLSTESQELQPAQAELCGADLAIVSECAREAQVAYSWLQIGSDGVCDAVFKPRWRSDQQRESESIRPFYRQYANTPAGIPEEETLVRLFAEVLFLDEVALDDDFFSIGGQSLTAISLVTRIREALGIDVPITTLFEASTPSTLGPKLRRLNIYREPLSRYERSPQVAASYAQRRLWFLDRLGEGSVEYNLRFAIRLRGELDTESLARAFQTIVERHESLRTRFVEVDGEPVQVIEEISRIAVSTQDLSGLETAEQHQRVERELSREMEQPFDLSRAPLLRVKLLKLSDREHVLLRTTHHIVSDGWSEGVFNRELMMLYEAYCEKRENPLKPLAVQYADYAAWQRQWLTGAVLEDQLSYWKRQLEGIPQRLELPTDRPRPQIRTFAANVCERTLDVEQSTRLKELGRQNQSTLYMTLLAAFAVLLARYTGEDDIVVGSGIANRPDRQLEDLIGFFVNSLVLRIPVRPEASFQTLLSQVRRTAIDAYRYQDVPFERLVEEFSPQRDLRTTPIYQIAFAFQNPPRPPDLNGLDVERIAGGDLRVRFDLELHAWEREDGIVLSWMYNRDLFHSWRIEQMAGHYMQLLLSVTADPAIRLRDLPLSTPQEQDKLIHAWSDTAQSIPRVTLPQLFEEQARKTPDAAAVVAGDSVLTFEGLNARANRVAHALIARGIGAEDRIVLILSRGTDMVIAVLGTLKAGGAYVPVDPDYPDERIAQLIDDARPQLALADDDFARRLPVSVEIVRSRALETECDQVRDPIDADRVFPLRPDHPAYVIFTSGSTGKPKGVIVSQAAVVNHMLWMQSVTPIGAKDRILQKTSFTFDASVWELFAPLFFGGQLVLAAPRAHCDPKAILAAIERYQISVVQMVPSFLSELLNQASHATKLSLERVFCGGEPLPRDLAERACAVFNASLYNLYGPTEATIDATWAKCDLSDTVVPVGRPIWNTQVYVLDSNLRPAPLGATGELYIAGAPLARGYLHRSTMTAERFVANPYVSGTRMYRTGDLVRWRRDGQLEFLGRSDRQIKIRGLRIELGEVEAALRADPSIAEAVVSVHNGESAEKQLVAYVVPANGVGKLQPALLRANFVKKLPEYMTPTVFVVIGALPLTSHGKLDRERLPAPDTVARLEGGVAANGQEEILSSLFAEVLGVERVGLDDDFFQMGGHSLLATRLASWIRGKLDCDIPMRMIFEAPTVRQLSALIGQKALARPPLVKGTRMNCPLSYGQQRLWFIDRLKGETTEYNIATGLRFRGELDCEAIVRAIQTMVERHESLRTRFVEVDGKPVQVVEEGLPIEVPLLDLSGLENAEQGERIEAELSREMSQSFDLSHAPLLRVRLLKLGHREHVLVRTTHHIVSDGWSEGVFNRELMMLYEAYRDKRENPLKPLPVQYADYAAWQRQWLTGAVLDDQLSYWKRQLEGIPRRLELPTDRPRPRVRTFAAGLCRLVLPNSEVARLEHVSQVTHSTLYMTLLGAFAILLARYTGQEDIVIGFPITNRHDVQSEGIIGYCLNSLPMRIRVSPDATVEGLLSQVRQTAIDAYRHQDLPFDRLVEEIAPERDLSTTPIFQVWFAMQDSPDLTYVVDGIQMDLLIGKPRVRFDIELHARQQKDQLELKWLYNMGLFDDWRVQQIAQNYRQVLLGIIDDVT